MAAVIAALSMSLDGFTADPADQVGPLFDWYANGEVEVPTANPQLTFRTSQASAQYPREDAPFRFVTDGVERAVAQAKATAGARWVEVGGPNIAQQCLDLGLLDEVRVDLVPVLLGEGIRVQRPDQKTSR
jgi:dihydrofolate reductase